LFPAKSSWEILAPKVKKGEKAAGKALRSEVLPFVGGSIPIPSSNKIFSCGCAGFKDFTGLVGFWFAFCFLVVFHFLLGWLWMYKYADLTMCGCGLNTHAFNYFFIQLPSWLYF
jgi:hypothetical protein